jgi:glycosyltransferase involved in cell wall biosynthesis
VLKYVANYAIFCGFLEKIGTLILPLWFKQRFSPALKILFTFGGLPHYYNLVLNRLQAIPGQEIVVVVPQKNGQTVGAGVHEVSEGIHFKKIHLPEIKAWWGKVFFKDFLKTLQAEKPDVLVTIWPYFLAFVFNPILYWNIRRLGVKIILKEIPFNIPKKGQFYDYFANGGALQEDGILRTQRKSLAFYAKYTLLKYCFSKAFNWVDAHVDYCEEAYEIFGSYGVQKEKIFIIYNSPDTDLILEEKVKLNGRSEILEPNPLRLLHVGRLVKWKRVDLLLEVFKNILEKYPSAQLVVVGTGPELENLQAQAAALHIDHAVNFVGGVYDMPTLGQYFNASAVYVLAGMGGLSINDAMCFDKAIVCTTADGTEKKLVRDGYNGYIFENGNAFDLQQKLELLLENPTKAVEMGQNSGKIIKDEVNIHVVVANYQKAFKFVTCSQ